MMLHHERKDSNANLVSGFTSWEKIDSNANWVSNLTFNFSRKNVHSYYHV
jgi:hypothetical protein